IEPTHPMAKSKTPPRLCARVSGSEWCGFLFGRSTDRNLLACPFKLFYIVTVVPESLVSVFRTGQF
ncbi:MAG: hypothetical protein QM518_14495, partial [Verrucomicrobiota bacterium]|nr:hypothetical protein [Verrucomicrobiota bacterium]